MQRNLTASQLLARERRGRNLKSGAEYLCTVRLLLLDLEAHEGRLFLILDVILLPNLYSFQLFGWQTFKRVGASLTINRVYQIVLVLSIALQLCLYFIIVTVSLWLDQLFNTAVAKMTTFDKLYKITSIITLVVSDDLCNWELD